MTPDMKRLCEAAESAALETERASLGYTTRGMINEAIVRSVLAALREPSEQMNFAGTPATADYPWDGKKPSRVFTAMIDHILSDPVTA